jgi:uncharacterized protein (DUF486 family)
MVDGVTVSTAATTQLRNIVGMFSKFLPTWLFPYVGFVLAGSIVFVAWFGGRMLFPGSSLLVRILGLWGIALLEYSILIPTIGGSVEVLKISESTLAVLIHAVQLIMFMILNRFTLKAPFQIKHAIAFALIIASIFVVVYF